MKPRRTKKGLLRRDARVKARDVDMVHGTVRVIRDGRLEVDAMRRRGRVVVVCSHGVFGRR